MHITVDSKDFKRIIMNCDEVCDKRNFDYLHFRVNNNFLYVSVIWAEGMENITYTGKCKLINNENNDEIFFITRFTETKEIANLIGNNLFTSIEIMDIDKDTMFRLNMDNGIMFRLGDHDIILHTYNKDFPFMNDKNAMSCMIIDYELLIKSMSIWINLYDGDKNDAENWKYFYIDVRGGKIRYTASSGMKLIMTEAGITESPDAVMAIPYDIIKQIVKLRLNNKNIKLIFTFDYLSIQGEDFEIRIRNNGRTAYNYEVIFRGLKENGNAIINSETFREIINNLKIANLKNYDNDVLRIETKNKKLVGTLNNKIEYITQEEFEGNIKYQGLMNIIEDICNAFNKEDFMVITYTIGWMILKTKDNINILIAGYEHN